MPPTTVCSRPVGYRSILGGQGDGAGVSVTRAGKRGDAARRHCPRVHAPLGRYAEHMAIGCAPILEVGASAVDPGVELAELSRLHTQNFFNGGAGLARGESINGSTWQGETDRDAGFDVAAVSDRLAADEESRGGNGFGESNGVARVSVHRGVCVRSTEICRFFSVILHSWWDVRGPNDAASRVDKFEDALIIFIIERVRRRLCQLQSRHVAVRAHFRLGHVTLKVHCCELLHHV